IAVLPLANLAIGLDAHRFGAWVGASVHDVGQVVATAQTAEVAALAIAVTIKLVRVLMLAPMVAIVGTVARRHGEQPGKRPPIVPFFVLAFVVVAVLGSFIPVPEIVRTIADVIQTILFGLALFSIGASLRLLRLFRTDGRSVLAGAVSWIL